MNLDLPDRRAWRDLALLYLAIEGSPGGTPPDARLDTVAGRLAALSDAAEPSDDHRQIVREASALYGGNGWSQAVEAAVAHLGAAVPEEAQRQAILEDLVEVGLADDKFLHEEVGSPGTELEFAL